MGGKDARGFRRPPWWTVALVAAVAVVLYVGLPSVAGVDDSWGRLSSGDPLWLAGALVLELASYAAYVFTFHRMFAGPGSRIGWRESYDVALAGVAASRLLATAGVGGIALSAWALAHSGLGRREQASGLTTFYVALYGVFMAALVVGGTGLRSGLLSGPAPLGLTVVPAAFGGAVICTALLAATLPPDLGGRVAARMPSRSRARRWAAAVAGAAATVAAGVRGAVRLLRHRDPALLGAAGWWGFDLAVLWACFHAFDGPPPLGVVVMAYFTGMLGNLLPLPGGLGGVEGGMIGALVGFGVEAALAVPVVLSYRAFAYWLPILPGVISYVRLLRTVRGWRRAAAETDL